MSGTAEEERRRQLLSRVLSCMADLAPGGGADLDVTRHGFAWLGTPGLRVASAATAGLLEPHRGAGGDPFSAGGLVQGLFGIPLAVPRGTDLTHLAELDALHSSEGLLRLGWLFLTGTVMVEGKPRGYCQPLLSMAVSVHRPPALAGWTVQSRSTWDLALRVASDELAASLEQRREFGGSQLAGRVTAETLGSTPALRGWVAEVVAAAGLPPVPLVPPEPPDASGPLRVVVGYGIFATRDVESVDLQASLSSWSSVDRIEGTAFGHLYARHLIASPLPEVDHEVHSPFVLTAAQQAVLLTARAHPVTVVSGPPGTGKSHVSVAVAVDAVARGQSVLMATRSAQAADVLADLLERRPGPNPVLFGGGDRASRLAQLLSDGIAHPAAAPMPAALGQQAAMLAASVDALLAGAAADLAWRQVAPAMPGHRERCPGLFVQGADLRLGDALVARTTATQGTFPAWGRKRALKALRRLAGARDDVSADQLRESLAMAWIAVRAAQATGTVPPELWAALEGADERWRDTYGAALGEAVRQRTGDRDRLSVATLAAALRAGRATRRRHLRSVDATALTKALPLWIGTLGDIEELLPQVPKMFDLVVLDEASQIDLLSAAPALLRGARVVVVGDPRQLRFVSFLGDDEVQAAVGAHGLQGSASGLDLRRMSAFDLAAGSAPVTFLDEHFRSWPHLIGFAAQRFYEGRLRVATRRPHTEQARCIEVRHVTGERGADGANHAEVEAVLEVVESVLAQPGSSIGLVTPFRAQADAIEHAVLDRIDLERIREADLRVGTVHAFQGDERDVMVLSLALDADGKGLRFLEDPNLFNVLVTRARRGMVVVTSTPSPPRGLLADFLQWAATPPGSLAGPAPVSWWADAIADALEAGGTPVQRGYRVGRQVVDLCVGDAAHAIAVETDVHPAGYAAHRARHFQLRRGGWRVVDAFPARYDGDPIAAAVALGAEVHRR